MKKLFTVLLLVIVASMAFASYSETFKGFSAKDQNDKTVTDAIFKDYDITLINVFSTTCYYCMVEMPDLVKLHDNMPKGANLVLMCADAYENAGDFKEIIDYYKIDFTAIKITMEQFSKHFFLFGFPTTLVVDKNGNILNYILGAKGYDEYYSIVESLLADVRSSK